MRASTRIVAGSFCAAELEPGTFHVREIVSADRQSVRVDDPIDPPLADRLLHTDDRHG